MKTTKYALGGQMTIGHVLARYNTITMVRLISVVAEENTTCIILCKGGVLPSFLVGK